MTIDIDDAIDRLRCMANEIVIQKYLPKDLEQSLEKDRKLLKALIPVLQSLKQLESEQ